MNGDGAKHDIAAYAGYIDDVEQVLQCTSGGLATAMSERMIRDGGYVAGVRYSNDFRKAQYHITRDLEDLNRFRGSKYVEVDNGTICQDVKALLDEGQRVLFFGLPCMVGALKHYLQRDYENLITVELICHGPTLSKVHQQYIDHLERNYQSEIVDFSVRKKLGKWEPGYLYAEFANGKTFAQRFYDTEYGYAFKVMSRPACYSCRFRGDSRVGDIMIGDFWGATEKDPFWNEAGVSAILVHTSKGLDYLKTTPGIRLFETTFERILEKNPSIIEPRKVNPNKAKLEGLLAEHELIYSVKHTMGIKTKLKKLILRIVPSSSLPLLAKLYNSLRR